MVYPGGQRSSLPKQGSISVQNDDSFLAKPGALEKQIVMVPQPTATSWRCERIEDIPMSLLLSSVETVLFLPKLLHPTWRIERNAAQKFNINGLVPQQVTKQEFHVFWGNNCVYSIQV